MEGPFGETRDERSRDSARDAPLDSKAVARGVRSVDPAVGGRIVDAGLAGRSPTGDQYLDRTDRWNHRTGVHPARVDDRATQIGRRTGLRHRRRLRQDPTLSE